MALSLRRLVFVLGAALVLATAVALALGVGPSRAEGAIVHGQLVPEDPRRDVPVVLDGSVYAHAQMGDRIFVGGDFQQVQLPDGSILNQAYIFAYDIDTGAIDPSFAPVLNNSVRALELAPDGNSLYVGGRFWKWDTRFPNRIAKLNFDGSLDTTFTGSASAVVHSIAARADRIFLAGDFQTVSGQPRIGFAAVDANTGAADAGFVMDVGLSVINPQLGRTVVLSSDGNTLFGMHFGRSINGQTREALMKVDVSAPTAVLSPWQVNWIAQNPQKSCLGALRDMAISPDDSFIVVGGQGADNPPNCDSVLRYPTAGNGAVPFDWSARMYSSVFSLAVSDVAVYVGGHFCAAPLNGAPPGGVTSTWAGTANGCDVNDPLNPVNPSVKDPNGAVFRRQLAALNPSNAQALAWDPGSTNDVGVFDLTLIERGLLMGSDGDRYNDILTGPSGFLDFGGAADTTPPTVSVTSPANGTVVSTVTALTGFAADDQSLTSVTVRLKNITTGQWLQADNATMGPAAADLAVTLTPTGLGTADWSVAIGGVLPTGQYEVRTFATDAVGLTTAPTLISSFLIPGAAQCSVALDANDVPVVSWSGVTDGQNSTVAVRRDGAWVTNAPSGTASYVDNAAAPGPHTYVVRWRPDGVRTDIPCGSVTVPPPTGNACTAVLNAAGEVELDWTAVAGAARYVVRDNDGWVATVDAGLSYVDMAPTLGDRTYVIRHWVGGNRVDRTCAPNPITVTAGGGGGITCTAVVNGNGDVVLNWSAIAGVSTYQVRDNAGWVATVSGALSYTDTDPGAGTQTYVVRYRVGGVRTDLTCTPDVTP